MLYVIYGAYKTIVRKNSKSLIKKILNNDVNELNFVKIDFEDSSTKEVLKEITFLPFGYDKKVILIENCEDILKDKKIDDLIESINLNDEYVDLILNIFNSKFAHKIFEKVENKKIIEIKELADDEWDKYISQYLNKHGSSITTEAINELKIRTLGDIDLLNNEMDKLINFTKSISLDDVKLLVSEPLNENSFELIESLIQGKKEVALKIYKDLLVKNNDPIMLISLLATQLKTLNSIYYLLNVEHLSNSEAADILKVKPGRIYFASKNLKFLTQDIIDKAFDSLYKLDFDIKHSLVDKVIGFELFILNFGGK